MKLTTRFSIFILGVTSIPFLNSCSSEKYLSDIDPAYAQIEIIQKDFSSHNPFLEKLGISVFTRKSAKKIFDSVTRKQSKVFSFDVNRKTYNSLFEEFIPKKYPTRYQDPLTYSIYSPIIKSIRSSASNLFPAQEYKPKFGTFYANSIQAEIKSSEENYFLLIHHRFVTFCHQMGKVALQPFEIEDGMNQFITIKMDSTTIENRLINRKHFKENFFYTFLEFNLKKFPPNDSLFLSNDYFEKALQYWNSGTETFLLGHEFSHALFKHKYSDSKLISDTTILNSWINEIKADSSSCAILNSIVENDKFSKHKLGWNKYLLHGGSFFLNTLKIFEEGQIAFEKGTTSSKLTKKEFETILSILQKPTDMSGNLIKFKSLGSHYKRQNHPPTEVRIFLINQLEDKLIRKTFHERSDFNLVEDFHSQLADMMIFSLSKMNEISETAYLNAYKIKDQLNTLYNK